MKLKARLVTGLLSLPRKDSCSPVRLEVLAMDSCVERRGRGWTRPLPHSVQGPKRLGLGSLLVLPTRGFSVSLCSRTFSAETHALALLWGSSLLSATPLPVLVSSCHPRVWLYLCASVPLGPARSLCRFSLVGSVPGEAAGSTWLFWKKPFNVSRGNSGLARICWLT